ncbi:MAG: SDR family oxidoreductase [Vitreoscilla sp.]|nr:SDR family oxidoreductase [Burkholderiales bacterium]MBP6336562.1 SDR family oxidoreductase [Vitreoscilla sp.]MBP6673761.1 SDR family oxidoreductase [Vitreoscilla sp.]
MSGSLAGKHALVTGAARGIGAAIALRLAAEGATLTLLGRDALRLQTLLATLPGKRHGIAVADVADEAQVAAAFAETQLARGPVLVLVNNAGQAESAPLHKTSTELWQRMLAVNLTGTFLCSRAALPGMLQAGWGRVINIASTAGQRGYAYVAAYSAAKHGVLGLTRSMALEVAKKGITVNAVCPGYTETDILTESIANVMAKTGRSEAEARAEFAASNPQGRIVQPQQVADAVAWLCADAASAMTGQALSVSGGEVM